MLSLLFFTFVPSKVEVSTFVQYLRRYEGNRLDYDDMEYLRDFYDIPS